MPIQQEKEKERRVNPIAQIRGRLESLKVARENVIGEIYQLESEKEAVQRTLPIILQKLQEKTEQVQSKLYERSVYDRAIHEIEESYHDVLEKSRELAFGAIGVEPEPEDQDIDVDL
eukprot:CAMPEP_0118857432 /NCGR_PEP_ID=MMETSP1163-20130328/4537_1 /TAXON_ID=124430 /ORGANISM="Phaeomonas parva, Strain CCMP2877" /LENGTH=116 /DNA_ID=CAMNT_0006790745 /DNA_START=89 /DNA_END=442 /DNA_ORIENTATION=+